MPKNPIEEQSAGTRGVSGAILRRLMKFVGMGRVGQPRARSVLIIIATDAKWHPVVRFSSQMLSERNFAVDLVYEVPPADLDFIGPMDFGANSRLLGVRVARGGWRGKLGFAVLVGRACLVALARRHSHIIAYDPLGLTAASAARLCSPGSDLVYHNLDLTSSESVGLSKRLLQGLQHRAARNAALVVVSSPGRSDILAREAGLRRPPVVVRNCQRLNGSRHESGELDVILRNRGLRFDRLVVRLGSMGPLHALEATIESVSYWVGDWGLILAGVATSRYLDELKALLRSLGLADRVVLLPSVSDSLWLDCLYRADLGIALYELGNINHESMAGAGNKLNLYLKAGIPSIVPRIADFERVAQEYGVAAVADPGDPRSIGAAVNAILGDADTYRRMAEHARVLFQREFNFETQYGPVLDWLQAAAD